MSSFAGQDLFGTGPHKMVIQPVIQAAKLTGFAGLNGIEDMDLGQRGYPITITGQLKAANAVALNVIIGAIETYRAAGKATLVDSHGITWTNVRLGPFRILGPWKYTSLGVFVTYRIEAVKLY